MTIMKKTNMTKTPVSKTKESWEDLFDSFSKDFLAKYPEKYTSVPQDTGGQIAYMARVTNGEKIKMIREFIEKTLSQRDEEVIEILEGLKDPTIYGGIINRGGDGLETVKQKAHNTALTTAIERIKGK